MTTVIKAGQAGPILRRLSTVDLADHLAEAQGVIDAARRKAAGMVGRARGEADGLLEAAKRSGFEAGFEQGRAEGAGIGQREGLEEVTREFNERHTRLVSAMEQAVAEIDSIKRDLTITAESDLLDFAVMVASRLTYEIGRLDREAAKANLSRALRLVSSKTDVLIRVHPDDLATMEAFAGSVIKQAESSPAVRLEADESMAPGGCRVGSAQMEIDATLETQIDAMVALLLGKTKADD